VIFLAQVSGYWTARRGVLDFLVTARQEVGVNALSFEILDVFSAEIAAVGARLIGHVAGVGFDIFDQRLGLSFVVGFVGLDRFLAGALLRLLLGIANVPKPLLFEA